ncbi:hypothetical protein [Streptomyces sp. NPDC023588]|uniref:hypothetical protein n=1 Tax=Streptomyces sp. NPDC023588 TaxID=3154907 RepID=UPI0033F8D55F
MAALLRLPVEKVRVTGMLAAVSPARLGRLRRAGLVRLDLGGLRHLDHACLTALEGWERKRTPLPGREGVT